jgi:transcription elongation GreA/GreB family factor
VPTPKSYWTPERRAQRAAQLKARWQDPVYAARMRERLRVLSQTPEAIERARIKLAKWHDLRRTSIDADATWRAALGNANRRPAKRKSAAKHMKITMARPEMREHVKRISKIKEHKRLNGKIARRKRGGQVPERFELLYRELRGKKVPARQAFLMVIEHAKLQDARRLNP